MRQPPQRNGFFEAAWPRLAPMAEAGVLGLDAALRLGDRAARSVFGAGETPAKLDNAVAEAANRALRVGLRTPLEPAAVAATSRDVAAATVRELWPQSAREALALPYRLPLSLGSLFTREALRGLAASQAVAPRQMVDFLEFVIEIFSDLRIYFSLRYGDEIARWQARVDHSPGDARARLELGRTYLKCGLFPEAVAELGRVADDRRLGSRALYQSLVARNKAGDFSGAVRDGCECLERYPSHEEARYWLWLSARELGGYPDEVPAAARMQAVDGFHPPSVELEDVTAELGLDKISGGRGIAVFDAHGDGRLDVVVAGAHSGCSLFRNEGGGRFTDVSTGSGLDRCVYGFALAAGDYDNDGNIDLYISSLGFYDGCGALMRNNGDGTFTDVTDEAGVRTWGPGFVATWVDYDNDGHLDLFLANNQGGFFDPKRKNRLFHNNGDGTFTDVTDEAGLWTPWSTIGATWGDFHNCGLPDLFVSGLGRPQLFRNNGDGSFADVSAAAGIDRPAIGSVSMACDVDDDGWLDIVQTTYSRPREAIHTLRHGSGPPDGTPLRVWRNNRDGSFTNIAPELGITGCWGTMSAAMADVGNSGCQDLFLGNGDPRMDRTEAALWLENDGRRFHNVTFAAGLPPTGKGHGVVMADLLGDGRVHLLVANGGLYPGDLQTTAVYRPRTRPGNYLTVRLRGTVSNRDAIGARLILRAGGREQHRLVSVGSGFGCPPTEQHFGLADVDRVETLDIRWPSGRSQRVETPPVNTTIYVVEGEHGWRSGR